MNYWTYFRRNCRVILWTTWNVLVFKVSFHIIKTEIFLSLKIITRLICFELVSNRVYFPVSVLLNLWKQNFNLYWYAAFCDFQYSIHYNFQFLFVQTLDSSSRSHVFMYQYAVNSDCISRVKDCFCSSVLFTNRHTCRLCLVQYFMKISHQLWPAHAFICKQTTHISF